jgi:hypothetical protein
MDYRDERDALRGRVDNLEQDLSAAREALAHDGADHQRIADLERQSAEARRLLDQINRELEALRDGQKPTPVRAPAPGRGVRVAGILVACLIAAVGVLLFVRTQQAPPVRVVSVEPVAPPPVEPPPATAAPSETAPPPAPESTAVPPPAPVSTIAHWTARVTRATGRALAPGTACRIEATLVAAGGKIKVPVVSVECRGERIYDSADKLEGMSMWSGGAEEHGADRPGVSVYLMQFHDTGSRSGKRTQVSVDTLAGSAAVWSENAPAFHVDLAVSQESEPSRGEPLMASLAGVLRRSGTVTEVSGTAPLRTGARCDLRVSPIAADKCMARLACGGAVLYGKSPTSGMASCTLSNAGVAHVSDREPTSNGGDPELDVDAAAGTMVLADEIGGKKWSVTFRLDP